MDRPHILFAAFVLSVKNKNIKTAVTIRLISLKPLWFVSYSLHTPKKNYYKPRNQMKLWKLPPRLVIFTFSSSWVQEGDKIEKETSSYNVELSEISCSITELNRHPAVSDKLFWQSFWFGNSCEFTQASLLAETSTVTAIACPLLCSQSCYSGPFCSEWYCLWYCLIKQRDPDLSVTSGSGCWSKESAGFLLPLLVQMAVSAVWAWRRRSPWDPGWWWNHWLKACWGASGWETWAAAAAGPDSWTVLIPSAA